MVLAFFGDMRILKIKYPIAKTKYNFPNGLNVKTANPKKTCNKTKTIYSCRFKINTRLNHINVNTIQTYNDSSYSLHRVKNGLKRQVKEAAIFPNIYHKPYSYN